jgi:hypothetical protein
MDVLTLSRIQFAATISFHYIYPPLSIGRLRLDLENQVRLRASHAIRPKHHRREILLEAWKSVPHRAHAVP